MLTWLRMTLVGTSYDTVEVHPEPPKSPYREVPPFGRDAGLAETERLIQSHRRIDRGLDWPTLPRAVADQLRAHDAEVEYSVVAGDLTEIARKAQAARSEFGHCPVLPRTHGPHPPTPRCRSGARPCGHMLLSAYRSDR